jgi:hypothetical protein
MREQQRRAGMTHHHFGLAAEHQFAGARVTVGAHDDEVGRPRRPPLREIKSERSCRPHKERGG